MTDSVVRPPSKELYSLVKAVESRHVAELLGLAKARERDKYACPVHGGSDSLHAYHGPNAGFFCFVCGGKGLSNIDVAAATWGVNAADACRMLADHFGIRDPGASGGDQGLGERLRRAAPQPVRRPPRPVEIDPRTAAIEAELALLREDGCVTASPASIYTAALDALTLTDVGGSYLAGRGFNADDAEAYGFRAIDGAAGWDALMDTLRESFLPAELALAGLQSLPWEGRVATLVIPYQCADTAIALRFRRLDDKRPRYHTLALTHLAMPFNAAALERLAGEELHIVEGELNAYALHLHGLRAVGLAGAGAWRETWTPLVRGAARLIAWYDADTAGLGGAEKLAATLQSTLGGTWLTEHTSRVILPHEQDANDLHLSGDLHGIVAAAPWRS